MKKLVFITLTATIGLLLAGCASQSAAYAGPAANPGGMTLDRAIATAAVRIDERIAPGSKIALLNFSSPSDRFSLYVLDELSANLLDSRILTVVDRREVDLIRDEFDFQFSGEVGDDSIQAVGQMLGAQSIVTGSLTEIGGDYRIAIRVLNVQTAAIEVHFRSDINNDRRVQALLAGGRTAVATRPPQRPPAAQPVQAPAPAVQAPVQAQPIVQVVNPQPDPVPAAPVVVVQAPTPEPEPARLANGRRTFHPSPQAYQGARAVNAFVEYIIVRNEYMIISLSGRYTFWNAFRNSSRVHLQDLDRPDRSFIPLQSGEIRSGGVGQGQWFMFRDVIGTRFSLIYTGSTPRVVFEEIRIGAPD